KADGTYPGRPSDAGDRYRPAAGQDSGWRAHAGRPRSDREDHHHSMTPDRSDSGNLGEVFAAWRESDRIAVIDLYDAGNPREISFRALDAACNAVARGLVRAGLGDGDRIAIIALNRVEFLEVMFGAMRAGCVPVMVNAKLTAEQVRFI